MDIFSIVGTTFTWMGGLVSWLIATPFHLTSTVITYPLAPVAVYCCSTSDRKHLEFPFEWLETLDNDLGGDSGWVKNHIEPGSDRYSYWNRTAWIWRNGGHGLNYGPIGIDNDRTTIGQKAQLGYTMREDGAWLYRDYFQFSDDKKLEIFWGWNLWGNINGRNKYVFTTRIKNIDEF